MREKGRRERGGERGVSETETDRDRGERGMRERRDGTSPQLDVILNR
jgi:hypothetical protein